MRRRDLFKIPFLGFFPQKEKEKRKKTVYRYFFPGTERLFKYAIYLEGDDWIYLRGQYIYGDEGLWKLRYWKTSLFIFERDWKSGICTKTVYEEKDWVYFVFDSKSSIG